MKKVYIEITNKCNLNCSFCLNTNREKEELDVEQFENIVKEVKEYTSLICLHIKGEPLLHSEFGKILGVLDKYNLKTNITTNGILLDKRIEEIINSNSVRQINISLHSALENEWINIDGYMNRILKNIDLFQKHNIIISFRLWNLKELNKNEFNKEIISHLSNKYNKLGLEELLKVNEWIKLSENVFINQDTKFLWPNMNNEIINKKGRCLAIKEQIGILVNGDVIPCCIDSEGEIKLGNIFENRLKEILESDRAMLITNNFKNGVIYEQLCQRCGFLKRLEEKRIKS